MASVVKDTVVEKTSAVAQATIGPVDEHYKYVIIGGGVGAGVACTCWR